MKKKLPTHAEAVVMLKKSSKLRKNLAKYIAKACFRNTELENIHAGEKCGGYGPGITDENMKRLMIDVVDHTYTAVCNLFVSSKFLPQFVDAMKTYDYEPTWNDPKIITIQGEGIDLKEVRIEDND